MTSNLWHFVTVNTIWRLFWHLIQFDVSSDIQHHMTSLLTFNSTSLNVISDISQMWAGKWSSIKDEPKVVTSEAIATPPVVNNNNGALYYDDQLVYDQSALYAPPIGECFARANNSNFYFILFWFYFIFSFGAHLLFVCVTSQAARHSRCSPSTPRTTQVAFFFCSFWFSFVLE